MAAQHLQQTLDSHKQDLQGFVLASDLCSSILFISRAYLNNAMVFFPEARGAQERGTRGFSSRAQEGTGDEDTESKSSTRAGQGIAEVPTREYKTV